jgi:nucleoside-diphosphate-sugar epimerase
LSNRYIVTGGAGFIGSGLVRHIIARTGERVGVIDNFLTGRRENLDEVRGLVDLIEADIRDRGAVTTAVQGAELVFHLAAIPSVPRSINDPVPAHECNIDGTFNVLLAAREARVRRVVYAASSSAYGDTDILPKVETMAPRPKSPYAAQKLMGEYYAGLFASCFGLETVSLRFFNVYGPRQDPSSPYSGVLSIFMRCILERTSPVIYA